jgi:hypothetical protein
MNNRLVGGFLWGICLGLVIYEVGLLAVFNYRKMSPGMRNLSVAAAVLVPFVAWFVGRMANRYWRAQTVADADSIDA